MEKALYTCPYCKRECETPGGLARCILSCEEKIQKEKEEEKKAKLAADKETRYQEIEDAISNLETLLKNWNTDYGSFVFRGKYCRSPYFWHMLF